MKKTVRENAAPLLDHRLTTRDIADLIAYLRTREGTPAPIDQSEGSSMAKVHEKRAS